jgi:hypothetical protein
MLAASGSTLEIFCIRFEGGHGGRTWMSAAHQLGRHTETGSNSQINMLGTLMTRTSAIFRFTQRALWIYVAEAVVVLGIILIARAFT